MRVLIEQRAKYIMGALDRPARPSPVVVLLVVDLTLQLGRWAWLLGR